MAFGPALPATTDPAEVGQAVRRLSADSAVARNGDRRPVHRQFVRMAARHPFRPCLSDSSNPGKDLTLAPNDKYWGKRANLDQVVYRFISDSAQQVPALQNKEVDLIYPQPQLDAVSQVKQIPDVNGVVNFGLSFEHLDFNFKNPILGGPDGLAVRKAFAMALDRPAIVQRTVAQFDPKAAIDNNRIYVNNQPEYVDNGKGYAAADVAGAKKTLEAKTLKELVTTDTKEEGRKRVRKPKESAVKG